MIILIERVKKNDIRVRFFQPDKSEKRVWEADANFNETDVHHQLAIVLR